MIVLEKVSVKAGKFRLDNVDLEVPGGSYAALMGRTGSGKTTLLEVITGLKPVLSGRIWLGGIDVTQLRPAERNIGYVPQDGALFQHISVRDQLAFALVVRRRSAAEIRQRVGEMAEMLEIEHLLDRTSDGLSGGERQRVALGRALSFHPTTLCLDEPLSALDDTTRGQMYELLKTVQQRSHVTALHVTHSQEEARHLADVIFSVEQGRLTRMPDARHDARQDGSAGGDPVSRSH